LWADTFEVTLHPAQVRLARRSLFGRRASTPVSVQVGPDMGGASEKEPWRPVLAALDDALRRIGAPRTGLRVVLSDHFVRYALIPWSAELVADAERLAFAQLVMREVFGPAVDGWSLCLGGQPAGQPFYCAGIDAGLVDALRDLAGRLHLRLRAVEPLLGVRIQRHRRSLKERAFCFASLESGRMTLAFHGALGWEAVRGRRTAQAVGDELARALRQEAAAAGADRAGTVYLAGDDLAPLGPVSVVGWKVVRLDEAAGVATVPAGARPATARG